MTPQIIYSISLGFVFLAVAICGMRMLLGPTLPDRVIALDLTANIAISLIALLSIVLHQPIYLDVIVALALIIFLTTVAFAKFILAQAKYKRGVDK